MFFVVLVLGGLFFKKCNAPAMVIIELGTAKKLPPERLGNPANPALERAGLGNSELEQQAIDGLRGICMESSQSYEAFTQSLNISPEEIERLKGTSGTARANFAAPADYAPSTDLAARIEEMRKATSEEFKMLDDDNFAEGDDEIDGAEVAERSKQTNDDDDIPTDVLTTGDVGGMMSRATSPKPPKVISAR